MRAAVPTPSLVTAYDLAVYLVLDDFGPAGSVYREANESTDLKTVIDDLITGQYNKPVRVVAFNTAEGWSRHISEDVGREILQKIVKDGRSLPTATRDFVSNHVSEHETRRAEISVVSRWEEE